MSRRATLGVVGLVLALLAIIVLSDPRTDPYRLPPYDLDGTGSGGLHALVELVQDSGADLREGGLPDERDEIVLQVVDTFDASANRDLLAWVRAGGTLVTADPNSFLAPDRSSAAVEEFETSRPGECDIDALAGVGSSGTPMPLLFGTSGDVSTCFGAGGRAAIHVREIGDGLVIGLSTDATLLNENLGREDAAAIAVAFLAPYEGVNTRILDPLQYIAGEDVGDGTVLGAMGARGRQMVLQIVIAFLVWGFSRGRRLGRPVDEELPVVVPASELVLAAGDLLARGNDIPGVAEHVRSRARRRFGAALGLGPDPHPELLIATLRDQVRADDATLRRALLAPVTDMTTLLEVADHLDRIQEDLLGVPI